MQSLSKMHVLLHGHRPMLNSWQLSALCISKEILSPPRREFRYLMEGGAIALKEFDRSVTHRMDAG